MKSLLIATALFCSQFSYGASTAAVTETETPAVDAAQIIGEDFKPISLEEAQVPAVAIAAATASEAVAAPETVASPVIAANTTVETVNALPSIKPITLKEADIPVLTKVEGKKAEVQSPFARIAISLIVMAALFFGLVKFTKFWQKKTGIAKDDGNKIRVLNQHFLGPRKSLAIIRVAGETILIGVTDQNISHIKSLSLLEDEDVPVESPTNFASTLKTANNEEASENESAWSSIRDRVSTKIKEMRPL